jgi:hypothetical protein
VEVKLVAHTGFEPVISSLRGTRPRPLDECAIRNNKAVILLKNSLNTGKTGTPPGGLAGFNEEAKTEATENSRALCFQNIIISGDR